MWTGRRRYNGRFPPADFFHERAVRRGFVPRNLPGRSRASYAPSVATPPGDLQAPWTAKTRMRPRARAGGAGHHYSPIAIGPSYALIGLPSCWRQPLPPSLTDTSVGDFFRPRTMSDASEVRRRQRQIVAENAALVALLDQELYPADRPPTLNATDREVGAWLGQRQLVERLKVLLEESRNPKGGLPKVIRS